MIAALKAKLVDAAIIERVYYLRLPQKVRAQQYPAITFQRVTTARIATNDGATGMAEATVQVDIWAETVSAAQDIATLIRQELDATRSDWDGTTIQACFLTDESDLSEFVEQGTDWAPARISQTYDIHFLEE